MYIQHFSPDETMNFQKNISEIHDFILIKMLCTILL